MPQQVFRVDLACQGQINSDLSPDGHITDDDASVKPKITITANFSDNGYLVSGDREVAIQQGRSSPNIHPRSGAAGAQRVSRRSARDRRLHTHFAKISASVGRTPGAAPG
jgi:hypothetical protein